MEQDEDDDPQFTETEIFLQQVASAQNESDSLDIGEEEESLDIQIDQILETASTNFIEINGRQIHKSNYVNSIINCNTKISSKRTRRVFGIQNSAYKLIVLLLLMKWKFV